MLARSIDRSLNQVLNRIVQHMAEILALTYCLLLVMRISGIMVPRVGRAAAMAANATGLCLMLGIALLMRRWRRRPEAYEIGWSLLFLFLGWINLVMLWIEQDPLRLSGFLVVLPLTGIFIRRRNLAIGVFGLATANAILAPFLLRTPLPVPGYYVATLLMVLIFGVSLHLRVGMLLLRVRTLFGRLQAARGEVRELAGCLPICAWCKQVRDDKGYWQQVDAFLARRSGLSFTHGMCPACREKVETELRAELEKERGG